MRTLLILGMIIPNLAYAAQYMVLNYNEDVRIVIGNQKCGDGLVAVAQRRDNQFIRGCATFGTPADNLVRIQWEGKGSDFSVFDMERFYPVDTGK